MTHNPELGRAIPTGGFATNCHDVGSGAPVLLIHGSGPGVSAWANWRLLMPVLAQTRRVIAPDMRGFGFTERPADQRVRRLVLMGSVGVPFAITPGLDAVWGYTPSITQMRGLLDIFAFDRKLVTDELAQLRYQASIQPGFQEAFAAMFPAPRQRWVDAMASPEAAIRALPHQTLVVHGREDQVIPLANSMTLAQWIPQAQLHVFGQCGHWTQIEHAARFARLVENFLAEADAPATLS